MIAILRDDTYWPETITNGNAVSQHVYNPQQTSFFNAKVSNNTNSPGIGANDVFIDPWGSPYIITLDLNYDGKCMDYALNSMYSNNVPHPNAPWLIPGEAIVWSFGPYWKQIGTACAGLPPNVIPGSLNTGINKKSIVMSFQ